MTDNKKLALDKAGLQGFVDNQITPFRDLLDKVANKDAEGGVTMNNLLGKGHTSLTDKPIFSAQRPLSVGLLASEKTYVNGDVVIARIHDSAQSIADVYDKHLTLFRDLHDNLSTTITKLLDGQHDTLLKIDGKNFLDSLGTVPGDFQGTGGDSGKS
ncbi:type VII secretion system-associated protein [Actinoallomurus sp. NPDC050550]|uniref:type VII secretion system-associated protein n=1 Tax=Actinoallomurus sp. NPDC050550 TaxID=3154937 RepID=UPI0033DF67DC